ncbi:MAG: ASKHA domain-containing protein [Mariniphaga sp.]|nr:ASKHA domain-containing protein [Mariniphaga sp.]MDD4425277.1 ASKHA domain-containing protein [Mariniphaga sp.]
MPADVTITLFPLGKKIQVNKGTPLMDVLHEYGVEFPCGGKGICGRCKVRLLEGTLPLDFEQLSRLSTFGLEKDWRLACFCRVDSDITIEISQFEEIILADSSPFRFHPLKGFGIAVDVGTTTLVAQLLDLKTGRVMDAITSLNPQVKFGGDLISRIQACLDGKQEEMQKLIRVKIGEMIRNITEKQQVEASRVVLVGNTVMHHIFSGLDLQPLSYYPFESSNLGMQLFSSEQLNWKFPGCSAICFYPSIGSFVGSDILAGIVATNMAEREKMTMLIDLGTNGEIVLGHREKIICASTAAGPAFEGARISQGMRAVSGAISSIDLDEGEFKNHVIGNVHAKGICGSGLIDAMAVLLHQGEIGPFGEIASGDEKIKLAPDVYLTQQDIREFQLAKAAIAAGLKILLNRFGVTYDQVENVFIAGGFGNFLNLKHVIQTGLLEVPEEKIVKMGNTALIGAKMFLFEDESFIQKTLQLTRHLNLEGDPDFQDIYIEKMMLA